jgi:hypothetical protein
MICEYGLSVEVLHIKLHIETGVSYKSFVIMVKSADTADLKSADLNRSWGFKSPSGHHESDCYACLS